MKKLKLTTFILLFLSLVPFLQSCLGDDETSNQRLVICTITKPKAEEKLFYLTRDNGETLFPSNAQKLGSYKPVDGQRALVLFNLLDEKVPGYDYNIEILNIRDIQTKEIEHLNKENADKIGDDKINKTYMWISKDRKYLSFEYQFHGNRQNKEKHLLSLVINEMKKDITSNAIKDYIELEFRHNAHEDTSEQLIEGYVSFKLDKIKDQMKGKKGLEIRIKTIYNGEQFYRIDFPESK